MNRLDLTDEELKALEEVVESFIDSFEGDEELDSILVKIQEIKKGK
jgi:hypothetical protein